MPDYSMGVLTQPPLNNQENILFSIVSIIFKGKPVKVYVFW